MGALIEFVCVATAHRPRNDGEHPSTVTVHLGRWSYCDSPRDDGHEWVASGGVPLERLRRHAVPSVAGARQADRTASGGLSVR